MTRTRLPDWEQRLFTFLHDADKRSVEWGTFDCALGLASGAVEAQTGVDLTIGLRDVYSDEKTALKALKSNGWGAKGDTMDVRLIAMMGSFLTPAKSRHRGNIVLLNSDIGPGFGVRVGRDAQAFSKEGGMRLYRIPPRTLEWSVV